MLITRVQASIKQGALLTDFRKLVNRKSHKTSIQINAKMADQHNRFGYFRAGSEIFGISGMFGYFRAGSEVIGKSVDRATNRQRDRMDKNNMPPLC